VLALVSAVIAAGAIAITDHTNYNAGSEARIRLQPRANGRMSIRYAGEQTALEKDIAVSGSGYVHLWNIPWEARTGRYQVDFTPSTGGAIRTRRRSQSTGSLQKSYPWISIKLSTRLATV
jgi:hypothetical protein